MGIGPCGGTARAPVAEQGFVRGVGSRGALCDLSRERLGLVEQGVVGHDPVYHPRGGHHRRGHVLGR
jgi:hypothetical protein